MTERMLTDFISPLEIFEYTSYYTSCLHFGIMDISVKTPSQNTKIPLLILD